jgi:hypothetical protein
MRWEMTVKKVTVMRNEETGKIRIVPLAVLVKRCEGKSTDRSDWSGMIAYRGD